MINRAVILSTGDELTTGRVVDTNSSVMAAEFSALGVETAPGFRIASGNEQTLIWLSGVPHEMVAMLRESVLPWLREQRNARAPIFASTFKVHGITESKLDDLLKGVTLGQNAKLSFRA